MRGSQSFSRHAVPAVSTKVREQAAAARLVAQLHAGANGGHLLEITTVGVLGFLRIHRSHLAELRRAIDAAEARCDELDDLPEAPFQRPPEKLVF